jgi:phi13 family phage major tail protein
MPRQVGLRDIHIAILKTDTAIEVTYEKPIKLERAISAKLTPKMNSENIYSDDSVEEILQVFEGVDVEIEVNQLALTSRAILQGSKIVKGVLIENKDNIAPTIALGFKSKKSNGKYRFVWLLKGKFEIASDEYDTEQDKPAVKSAKLTGNFYSRDFDGNYRFLADEDETGVDLAIIESWFVDVPVEPVV